MHAITERQAVHIIAPFSSWAQEGGTWMRAFWMRDILRQHADVTLWSELDPAPALHDQQIRKIQPFRGEMPQGGTLIFIGTSLMPGLWYEHARPVRVMLECTMFAPEKLYRMTHRLSLHGRTKVEVRYCSDMVARLCALPGRTHHFSGDLGPFLQVERSSAADRFTVGRANRDTLFKYHFRDPAFYRKLAGQGMRVRLVGATCLRPWLPQPIPGLEMLPEMPRAQLPGFLATLDCFLYRTPLHCPEGFGNVVVEAMAAGLPVVAHCQGGYADILEHGRNGFLFETEQEAGEILLRLQRDSALGREVGLRARETAAGLDTTGRELLLADVLGR